MLAAAQVHVRHLARRRRVPGDNLTLVDKINFNQGRSQTCLFHCPKTGLKLFYHGDDIAAVSDDDILKAFHAALSGPFEANVKYFIGLEPGDDKEGLLLNRCISYTDTPVTRSS